MPFSGVSTAAVLHSELVFLLLCLKVGSVVLTLKSTRSVSIHTIFRVLFQNSFTDVKTEFTCPIKGKTVWKLFDVTNYIHIQQKMLYDVIDTKDARNHMEIIWLLRAMKLQDFGHFC